jgi:hypothetical protein
VNRNIAVNIALFCLLGIVPAFAVTPGASKCNTAISATPKKIQSLLQRGKLQEAIWSLRDMGRYVEAQEIEKKLIELLSSDRVIASGTPAEGGSESQILTLKSGIKGIWKPLEYGANSEIASWLFDRLFDLDLVSVTVPRTYRGLRGSLQYFVKNMPRGDRSNLDRHTFSPEFFFFEFVTNYGDKGDEWLVSRNGEELEIRKSENFGVRSTKREVLYDNADTFPNYDSYSLENIQKNWNYHVLIPLQLMNLPLRSVALPKVKLEKIKSGSNDQFKEKLGPYLGSSSIEQALQRRKYYIEQMGLANNRITGNYAKPL